MNITLILIAAAVVAATGIVVGLGLGIFGEKFKVEVDEREAAVRACLPGNNCGGCGYPGCDGLAKAINEGRAPVNACPVGQQPVADAIAEVMGVKAEAGVRKVAYVRCSGDCQKVVAKFSYTGIEDCNALAVVPGLDDKGCGFGCMGHGACVKACKFDAMHLVNGIARVDADKCTACMACVKTCPQKIITMVPYDAKVKVACASQARGKAVMNVCKAGCIACTLCTKQCEFDAIHMDGNVAVIDYEKCTACGACAAKCPRKVIHMVEK
ncbi:MAG: RnfABCDGE type electron transport complex subunit B [Eubacteriales bacterium]|nr:RnfABCDGE type electron transport complex subunit B [Eubacteriales bacterium]